MYPSLIEYSNRVFYDEPYPFVKGIEPPYLNRNWLMHGRMTREIERYECIQVLNALSVIEFMFGKDESDNQYVSNGKQYASFYRKDSQSFYEMARLYE